MRLYLDGHDFATAAQQIYMCMFENSHAEISDGSPCGGEYIISRLRSTGRRFISTTEIKRDGGCFSEIAEASADPNGGEEELRRAAVRAVKTSFYRAAVKLLPKPPEWGALTGVRPSKLAIKYIERGMDRDTVLKKLMDEYFVSRTRGELAVDAAMRAHALAQRSSPRDMSLYVGIPFCTSRCKYCSFVSHSIEKARGLVAPYLDMLAYEIAGMGRTAKALGLHLRSVYIGGGTPTSLTAPELRLVMERVSESFDISAAEEYTVEAGRPDTLDLEKLRVIKGLGATRISVNPQTMNNEILAAMDRRHTAEDVGRVMEMVKREGGLMVNMDLIAGLPGDTPESFESSLLKVAALEPENVTVHTLALKKGSGLRIENAPLPDGRATERMVDFSRENLALRGYSPYYLYRQKYMSGNLENVGYALPGTEGLYNNYIMDELHTILSAGAGGVTKLICREKNRIQRIFNPKYPYEYNNGKQKIDAAMPIISSFFANE